ncbi:MAG: 1,4-alpha-glucan branching protein GlgB [Planctomycetota bacterium]
MTRPRPAPNPPPTSLLTDDDVYLFNEGQHFQLYRKLGAHSIVIDDVAGTQFTVWAPAARRVSVAGDFNNWDRESAQLQAVGASGLWRGFVPGASQGDCYKYAIETEDGEVLEKADPFAFHAETPPKSSSVIWPLDYEWSDGAWLKERGKRQKPDAPLSIYEVHLGSWRRASDDPYRSLSYREIAEPLADWVEQQGHTHVELLPVMEHPYYGSWGYQIVGFFAPTGRYGTPQDLMYLIDVLHQRGIGVILDWVPSHFATDGHGLGEFDGTHLYEHADRRKGFHPDWGTYIFNYGRHEVRSFLISNALYWLDMFHVDGLRVDAVASMLYLDYSREPGQWLPNQYGGRENIEAIDFLRQFNEEVHRFEPDAITIAEESTSWPGVSRPASEGGLGFDFKWDMGWMHDSLEYLRHDPIHRSHHHDTITFHAMYAFSERFVLPLSHDEVVHGKGSLLGKMPGDDWQKRANLRLLFAWQFAQPGKKLLFMGGELGQFAEWNHDQSLDWHLLEMEAHEGIRRWVADLNRLYRDEPALHEGDHDPAGFQWIDCHDRAQSTLLMLRRGVRDSQFKRPLLIGCNFTPVPRDNIRVGVPHGGLWKEVLNSDAQTYGGSGQGNLGGLEANPVRSHGQPWSLNLLLPPLGAVFFVPMEAGETP